METSTARDHDTGAFSPPKGGVLPDRWLRRAVDAGAIASRSEPIPDSSIQPASIDLRLGKVAHRLRCSFLPGSDTVANKLKRYDMEDLSLADGAILERNRPYLIPLMEELGLPEGVWARANPRSSTGRVDVFTRVITDGGSTFDDVAPGYRGRLYLEVVSRSFTIKVRTGLSLNQLRLVTGGSRLDDAEIRETHAKTPLLFLDDLALAPERVTVSDGLFLSLDLAGDRDGVVGYRAKKNSRLLDLSAPGAHRAADFWEPVVKEAGDSLVLEPEEFYLLLSREAVRIPPGLASEMTAYDPTSGELRTHYAGFFDPGFGHSEEDALSGSRAALEVRAHDVPFIVEHGQRVCKLVFERLVEEPSRLYGSEVGSSYQGQWGTLSKHFDRGQQPTTAGQLRFLPKREA
ncbi:MAG: 2'-deoxycytidine 5'-triphosphate deaminase [Actinomycetota bacterium]